MKKSALFTQAAALCAFVFLLRAPLTISDSVREGLLFCAQTVIPSLFVYMVPANMFSGAPALFPGRALPYALILTGVLCGSPSGADAVMRLLESGSINEKQAECLLAVSGNASAPFIISFAGAAVTGSAKAGAIMLALKVAVSALSWMIVSRLRLSKSERRFAVRAAISGCGLTESLKRSVCTGADICGCIVFFAAVSESVISLTACGETAGCILRGIFEFSGGIGESVSLGAGLRYAIVCALLGWQGMSVHLQVSVICGGMIRLWTYIAVKIAESAEMLLLGVLTKGLVI